MELPMKKVLSYLRSMRFGILLLSLVALCSVVGSLIPQQHEAVWYVQNYEKLHALILTLGLDNIYESWYFILILCLLALNLTLCSVLRVRRLGRSREDEIRAAAAMPDQVRLSAEGVEQLRQRLQTMRCRRSDVGQSEVYTKNGFGRYGSFLTHLSILLTLLIGAAALYLPTVTDRTAMPGEAVVMDDGKRRGGRLHADRHGVPLAGRGQRSVVPGCLSRLSDGSQRQRDADHLHDGAL